MIQRFLVGSALALAFSASGLVACGSDADAPGGESESAGTLAVRLSEAPSDASCLVISVAGSRTVTKKFGLTAGRAQTFELDRLPVGVVKVDANAYPLACSKVKSSSTPSWVLEAPVTARIDALHAESVLLKLLHNGQGDVSVDFEAPPWLSSEAGPIDFAVIGDTPYGAKQIEDFPNLLADVAADGVLWTAHVGDIKNGSSRCDDAYFEQIFAGFQALPIPLVYTPGDNEWTDCHRASNGAYDPLERLDKVREVFFPTPGLALGGGFKQVLAQSEFIGFEKFVENQLWFESQVAFGTVHVVGSNDSTPAWYTDDTTGTKLDDPARRNAERAERNAATLDWLERLFELAGAEDAKGVVIFMQADMFDAFSVANNVSLDAFDNIVQKLADLSKAFGKPVLMLEGDSHVFIADKPLENGNAVHHVTTAAPNLTRIVVQGSTTTPLTEWLRVRVDPSSKEVFSWERNAR